MPNKRRNDDIIISKCGIQTLIKSSFDGSIRCETFGAAKAVTFYNSTQDPSIDALLLPRMRLKVKKNTSPQNL